MASGMNIHTRTHTYMHTHKHTHTHIHTHNNSVSKIDANSIKGYHCFAKYNPIELSLDQLWSNF